MPDSFFWYDVMTTDTKAAARFYGDAVGWTVQDSGTPQMEYSVFNLGGRGVTGLMPLPDDYAKSGGRPAWMGYIKVDDVDAMAARIQAEGGKLHKGPVTIPGTIRFAVVSDPQGAGFLIATPLTENAPPPLTPGTPGSIGWHELCALDWQAAFAFYEKLFGWTKAEAHNMGEAGTYQLFAAGDAPIGGMMNRHPAMPNSWWNYYFQVDGIDAAKARIEKAGGSVIMGPIEVPGGQWILQARDPQGGYFALVSARR